MLTYCCVVCQTQIQQLLRHASHQWVGWEDHHHMNLLPRVVFDSRFFSLTHLHEAGQKGFKIKPLMKTDLNAATFLRMAGLEHGRENERGKESGTGVGGESTDVRKEWREKREGGKEEGGAKDLKSFWLKRGILKKEKRAKLHGSTWKKNVWWECRHPKICWFLLRSQAGPSFQT